MRGELSDNFIFNPEIWNIWNGSITSFYPPKMIYPLPFQIGCLQTSASTKELLLLFPSYVSNM